MLPPGVIDRIKREREERDRPAVWAPIYPPEWNVPPNNDEEEKTEASKVIVIEL